MRHLLTAAAIALATAAVALASAALPAVAQNADTLRIGLREDPDILDPTLGSSYVGRIVYAALCDKLFDLDPKLNIVPQLATGYQFEDPTHLVIKLRSGVTFQDGEPLDAEAAKYSLTRHLTAKGSMRAGEINAIQSIEVVDPLTIEFSQATPVMARPSEAMQWLNAHHIHSPVTRHALVVLETIDAIDLAFDTFVCTLLDGEVDTSGYPEYSAIVGGVVSHWDEATGDMIARAVVGWGGKGARGDTDRIAAKLLSGILTNILANQYALGLTPIDRPVPAAGRGGLVCAHCGFASAHERAFYCPKCGMRLLRG